MRSTDYPNRRRLRTARLAVVRQLSFDVEIVERELGSDAAAKGCG